jgi:branched-chain amino acid transport system permease protein
MMTTVQLQTSATTRKFWPGMTLFCLALLIAPRRGQPARRKLLGAVIDFALLYIMLALGLNIVVGYTGLLDMGFIAFYAVGAIWRHCWPLRICLRSSRSSVSGSRMGFTPHIW